MDISADYSTYCAYRLPCGICTRTNSVCPLMQTFTSAKPPIVSVYAAPVYPFNHMDITTSEDGTCEQT